jgi:hypothetical protein
MQLSGLLEKLKGLFKAEFLISSVTPLFCFLLVNGVILGQFSEETNAWVKNYFLLDLAPQTVLAAIVSIALLVLAYVFSTFNLSLREILEGKNLPAWLTAWLKRAETERLNVLEAQFKGYRRIRRELIQQTPLWKVALRAARKQGTAKNICNYPEKKNPTRDLITELESRRWRGESLQVVDLKPTVDSLKGELTANSAELRDDENSRRLDRDHQRLVGLIDYARERAEEDYIRLFNEREFNFSRYGVAATRLGNIAESVGSYAFSRYGMNLDCFWTRLQRVLQGKKEFNETLRDAKTQLDFMVSFFWLTVASTALWLVALPLVCHTWLAFAAVWLAGPALARLWYLIAVQNYRSFADLLRSSVDLFRFDLLNELKIAPPPDSESERRLWDDLNRKIGYGDDKFICYKETK